MLILSNKSIYSIEKENGTLKNCTKDYRIVKKEESNMSKKIKIIIADDNVHICEFIRKFLEKYDDIEILGVANTDEDEVKMIEELKPEIVITDLMRNHKYTGLDIIKDYKNKKGAPEFLVIAADEERAVIRDGLKVAGYIKKPFSSYEIIAEELTRIKGELIQYGKI